MNMILYLFFFSSRRRHTRCALVTGVQTCALPISPRWRIEMRNRRPIAAALSGTALLMALGACGQREDLKPVADQAPPVTPIGATRPPPNEELTTPDPHAVLARRAQPLTPPEPRDPHHSDLPPPVPAPPAFRLFLRTPLV